MRGSHPNSLRNLKPWKPGQVPNPQGINKKRPFSDRYAEMGESAAPIELVRKMNKQFGKPILAEDCSWAMLLTARAYLQVYLRGDTNMLREIADRVEGRAPNRSDLMVGQRQEVTIHLVEDAPGGCYLKDSDTRRLEKLIFDYIVMALEKSRDEEDENFLTAAANLAQIIKRRAQQKGRPINEVA